MSILDRCGLGPFNQKAARRYQDNDPRIGNGVGDALIPGRGTCAAEKHNPSIRYQLPSHTYRPRVLQRGCLPAAACREEDSDHLFHRRRKSRHRSSLERNIGEHTGNRERRNSACLKCTQAAWDFRRRAIGITQCRDGNVWGKLNALSSLDRAFD